MLRDYNDVPYVPILTVRPAEMNALQELPNSDKDIMLPLIALRPWVGAYEFDSVLERVEAAYDERPRILDIDPNYPPNDPAKRRPVHDELDRLRDSSNGFRNWCDFIGDTPFAIPCIQIENDSETLDEEQINSLLELNQGLVLRLRRAQFGLLNNFLATLAGAPVEQLLVLLDLGQTSRDLLISVAEGVGLVSAVNEQLGNVPVVVAGTSFPFGFTDITQLEISERQFFNQVRAAAHEDALLIYGDYGSARDERRRGGGQPAPRIDYPLSEMWIFERWDEDDGYRLAAEAITESEFWDGDLRIWGTQMIERTVLGDQHAITSPARSTAARINIHLHRQTHYGGPPDELYDTEDDWED